MSDGALRTDVIRALRDADAQVDQLPEGRYRIWKDDELQIHRLGETVSRTVVDQLSRSFKIPKVKFFPPLKMVPQPTKAAGAESDLP